MKKITMEEYEQAKKPVGAFIKPIMRELDDMFDNDDSLKVVKIEKEDIPEEEQYRFDTASTLQKLAGLFRMYRSPLDKWYISVRNGGLYALRGKRPKSANKIRSNQ